MSQWIHPGIHAVFFDAVGTLIFPEPSAPEVYRILANQQGIDLPSETIRERFLVAFRAEEAVDRTADWITSERRERERWRTIVTFALESLPDPEAAFDELYEHFAKPSAWRLHAQAGRVLRELSARMLILGMGSNYDSRIFTVIEGFPALAPLADRVVVSSAIGHRKPAAEFFRSIVRSAGCEPQEVLFVGDDRDNDYDGAVAAGLDAVLLDPIGRLQAPRTIKCLSELL